MYLRTVLRSIPLSLAIADTDRPCRCKSSIIIISPILITEIPLPTIRRSINDHAPPVSRSALRKTGDSAKLVKIQTALLGSIEPASTYKGGAIREAACLAHLRRKIFDVHDSQPTELSTTAMAGIQAIYRIEEEIRGLPPAERLAARRRRSRPPRTTGQPRAGTN
ncbi:transposase [Mesorhizobium sp. M1216]|uniref:IS66 family transposase n=1 Tax=Mesorhizobium sp. M1216 TaxID=2957069 RepID=UPI0033388BF2